MQKPICHEAGSGRALALPLESERRGLAGLSPRSRREFVRMFMVTVVVSSLPGVRRNDLVAGTIVASPSATPGILRFKVSDFPALSVESGSVRLGLYPLVGTSPGGSIFPVIVTRGANNVFYAVNSRCTHQGCVVDATDPDTNQIHCQCHGSVFARDGTRISGPASGALTKYPVTFDGQDGLVIQVAGLGYSLAVARVASAVAGGFRLRLDFQALLNASYAVEFYADPTQPGTPASFALGVDDPADQTVYQASASGKASVFVDLIGTTGFYQVNLQTSEV